MQLGFASARLVQGRLGLLLLLFVASGVAAEPLRDEDVVRMFAAGEPTEAIVREIDAREVAFDLSTDMLDELRRAQLPEPVIAAMLRRQAQLHPADTAPAPTPAGAARPVLRLHVVGRKSRAEAAVTRLRVRSMVSPDLAATLELDAREESALADVALFVVDRNPRHVPDHWRASSPLGRDFVSMPRHKLLAFVSGARTEEGGMLVLEIPRTIEVDLEASGEPHDLSVGLACQVAGRYYRLVDASRDGIATGEDGIDLELSLTGGPDPSTLEVGLSVEPRQP